MTAKELREWIAETMMNLPTKEGAIFGIPASRYAELNDSPVRRIANDGIVLEVECTPAEEEDFIAQTNPVDFSRRGGSTIFIWYFRKSQASHYRSIFREHRQASATKNGGVS